MQLLPREHPAQGVLRLPGQRRVLRHLLLPWQHNNCCGSSPCSDARQPATAAATTGWLAVCFVHTL